MKNTALGEKTDDNRSGREMISVVQVVPQPSGGGAELLVRELNQRLRAHSIESIAVYFGNKRNIPLFSNEVCLGADLSRSFSALWRLRSFLRENTNDKTIIHGHLTDPLYALAILGAWMRNDRRRNIVYTEHDTYNRRRSIRMLRPVEKFAYGRYSRIICISKATRTALLDWIGHEHFLHRSEVINNGARLFRWRPRHRFVGVGLQLISVGSLTNKKGFDVALEAVANLGDLVGGYTIIGEGEERERLLKQASALAIQNKIQLVGWSDDVESWLHSSDLQLIPSRWEGFGMVAIEGLSTGLPIVASDVPGLNEVLRDTAAARLVPAEDSQAMASGIRAFYREKGLLERIARAARERAEQYTLDAMVAGYARVYREVAYGMQK